MGTPTKIVEFLFFFFLSFSFQKINSERCPPKGIVCAMAFIYCWAAWIDRGRFEAVCKMKWKMRGTIPCILYASKSRPLERAEGVSSTFFFFLFLFFFSSCWSLQLFLLWFTAADYHEKSAPPSPVGPLDHDLQRRGHETPNYMGRRRRRRNRSSARRRRRKRRMDERCGGERKTTGITA